MHVFFIRKELFTKKAQSIDYAFFKQAEKANVNTLLLEQIQFLPQFPVHPHLNKY